MRHIFIDESIHDRGDFIVIAAVYADDGLKDAVENTLLASGLIPGQDEFKSSMRMAGNSDAQELRNRLRFILMQSCKVAIGVCPVSERSKIMELACNLIARIDLAGDGHGLVHFDEGMKSQELTLPPGWRAELRCDSKSVVGIQVADCAAHIVSVMLLTELGIINKSVPVGEHYPSEEREIEMAWQLWTSLRYALSSGNPIGGYDEDGWCEPMMRPFGLLISESCSQEVKDAADKRLGSVWVGCIH